MTVYVTGRSAADGDTPYGGTVGETAELVTKAGGRGIAVTVDHSDDEAVAALFARVQQEQGRLDLLINNAAKLGAGYAAPLLIANGRGLIANTGHYGAVAYYHGPAYGAQKAGSDKMAADMAKELRPHNVAAVSIWMGGLDTERARAYLATLPEDVCPAEGETGIAAVYRPSDRCALCL
jgi:NAD(P)-dependent dehydrogenase (short-subunit alcohol dehydrogenase family)